MHFQAPSAELNKFSGIHTIPSMEQSKGPKPSAEADRVGPIATLALGVGIAPARAEESCIPLRRPASAPHHLCIFFMP